MDKSVRVFKKGREVVSIDNHITFEVSGMASTKTSRNFDGLTEAQKIKLTSRFQWNLSPHL